MSTCFNKNLKEYKDLLKVFKTDLSTDAAILKWQKQNKSDLIPTVDQVKEQNRINKNLEKHDKLKFKNALVNNLERLGIAVVQNKEVLITDADALRAYLIQIGVPLDFIKLKSTNEKVFKAEFILDKIAESKVKKIIKNSSKGIPGASGILAHLRRLFPSVNYKIVSSAEAEELYNSIPNANKAAVPFSRVKSFYNPVNNEVVLIKGRVNEETLIEEVLHPFIDAVYKDNQPLFKNLLKEAKSNFKQLNKEINSVYTDSKGFNQDWRNLELVTKALTKVFKNEYETQPTLTFKQRLQEFKRWFVKILNNIYKYITKRKKPLPVQTLTRKFRSQLDNSQQVSQERLNQVSELFESNPELANAVYEALGFNQETNLQDTWINYVIKKDNISKEEVLQRLETYKPKMITVYRGEGTTVNLENSNIPDYIKKSKGRWFTKDKKVAQQYAEMRKGSLYALQIPETLFDNISKELNLQNTNGVEALLPQELVNEKVKLSTQITPQQKQQALQLYSQYLDTIFPNSKVKDIVYRGDKSKSVNGVKEFLEGRRKRMLYLSTSKDVASNKLYWEDWTEFGGSKNFITAIVNIQSPYELDVKNQRYDEYEIDGKIEQNFEKEAREDKSKDSFIVRNVKEAGGILSNTLAIKKPEQIHILGSKADMQGFKEFVDNNQNSNTDSFNQQEESFNINIEDISEDASLSDIAKLLNTSDIQFDIKAQPGGKVKYALSEDLGDLLNNVYKKSTKKQKAAIEKLFALVQSTKVKHNKLYAGEVELSPTSSLVIMDDKRHVYLSLRNNKIEEYRSATTVINGTKDLSDYELNKNIGNEFDYIVESILLNKTFEEIDANIEYLKGDKRKQAYQELKNEILSLTEDGSILLPQVVVHDDIAKIAGTIDILKVTPEGKFTIIDLKTAKDSIYEKSRGKNKYRDAAYELSSDSELFRKGVSMLSKSGIYGLQVGLYSRMLENMGYEIDRDTPHMIFHVKVDITGKGKNQVFNNDFKIEGIDQQVESYNKAYVDMLIPDLTEDEKDVFEELDENEEDEDTGFETNETLESPEENEKDNNSQKYPRELFNTLLEYQKKLYKKQEALHVINSKIFLNKPQKEYEKNMFDIMHAIDNMIETIDADKINSLYTRVLRDFYTQIKDFKSYMTDPKNFNKPEYIGYALNYNRFIDGFSPLRTNYKDLNSTHTNLLLRIQSEINELKDPENIGAGIINDAIYNHVREIVKMSKQELTDSEIEDVLHEVEDIDSIEYYTGDLDTNRDVLARMIAKIYKMKLMEVHDRSDSSIEQIKIAARKLQMLSDNKDPQKMHDFMIGEDGRYVQKVSKKFYKEKYRLKAKLYDSNGNRKEFIEISDITKASPKDLEYNKQLAKDLEEYYDFFRAETRSEEGSVLDGNYYRYTDEFKKARAKFQVKVDTGEYIFWERNPEISELDYKVFENKYFEKPYNDIILRPHKENGVYTGLTVKKAANLRVKSAYKVPTDRTLSGESLIDDQYAKIMGIGANGEQVQLTALEEAQKEYYLIYTNIFEKVLKYLPEDQVAQMMGRLPVIRGNIMKDVKKMSDVKVKLWSKMVRGIKNLFEDDISVRNVSVDENGEIIQELPIFYTGDLRSERLLERVNEEIKELEAKYEAVEISREDYQEQMKVLKGRRNSIENAPSAEELNRDLTNGLIKFIGMAEYYNAMNEVHDTFKAIKHVMSERKTKEPGGVETLVKKTAKMTTKATREDLKKGFRTTSESNLMRRVNKYLHMVYYQDENLRKTTFDKIANKLINYSSLSYVAFNPFGNFNNYTVAKLSNNIEAFGGRYFSTKSYYRAVYEFNKRAIPDLIKRVSATSIKSKFVNTGDYDPNKASSKYEAIVELLRMMDSKGSLRETYEDSTQIRIWESFKEFGYVMQDAVEYNVQTKVGMAMVMDTLIMNPETGDHMSLYDAFEFDNETKKVKLRDGFTKIAEFKNGKLVPIADYNDEWRYEFRNKIREVNKQIHGNYAWEDRTVLEAQSWGRLLMQFHKWVAPAIKARFRKEYYDENLGWVEGRYRAGLRFVNFVFKKLVAGDLAFKEYAENFKKKEMGGKDSEQYRIKAENALKNAKRAGVEAFIIIALFGANQLLSFLADDDDEDDKELKRLKNFTRYQTDRVFKEFIMFTPLGLTEMYQMFKSPIASSRTLGEMGEALKYTLSTPIGYLINSKEDFYADNDYVYQKGIRQGQLKLSKNWQDVVPILYSIKKYEDFLNMTNFYIK